VSIFDLLNARDSLLCRNTGKASEINTPSYLKNLVLSNTSPLSGNIAATFKVKKNKKTKNTTEPQLESETPTEKTVVPQESEEGNTTEPQTSDTQSFSETKKQKQLRKQEEKRRKKEERQTKKNLGIQKDAEVELLTPIPPTLPETTNKSKKKQNVYVVETGLVAPIEEAHDSDEGGWTIQKHKR
jgi:hypothetical protein